MHHEIHQARAALLQRRWFLRDCGVGLAGIALHSLLSRDGAAVEKPAAPAGPLAPKTPHFPGRVKRVIYIFQAGAPSHLELFDHKPELTKRDGQLPPKGLLENYRAAFINPNSSLLGPKYKFAPQGECGMELSEILPHTAEIADDICLIRSMQTDAVNHAPAQIFMNTGSQQFGRPSFGAWTLYGLGSESQDLPGYVVLTSAKGTSAGASNYGSGFLPTVYGAVPFRSTGDPVLYLSNPTGYDDQAARASLDTLNQLNQLTLDEIADPATAARIQSYESAYRLQASAPELMDLSQEPQHILDMYGVKNPQESSFARNCLLARRLLDRDVRFVQLFHEAWDQHGNLTKTIKKNCVDTDQPAAALVKDLKQRGMLDDTLIVWAGEFGRTPMVQGGNDGRDHHNRCFSVWLAGGGVKPGLTYGVTDDLGFNVAENPVHVHDLNATLLHLLGFDHERLTHRFQGRDFRLTDVHGHVVKDILT
ncbi:DUF1501 domain-containing protein [Lignipirellula cremea]|uniref:Sulfatase n=1 Tax=Lignipirellula cremea TaxID=2528010 RepID=A0A518DM32_9BACT|nr:DUF1501 domain-containing protein [Lignipirellula cremea]QDU92899.1 hypothetical protein Pla8534_06720 [Lignipirellula cremea]